MNTHALDALARHLMAQLDCTQEVVCRQIMQEIAEIGQPLVPASLAAHLRMSHKELQTHLARIPDIEFDAQGNIVGWGISLLPTRHQLLLQGSALFTWCAFDTVLFLPLLHIEALVRSACSTSDQPITFVATPEGIVDLAPATSVVSLILPARRCDCVRSTFCQHSLFFQSEEAASPWLALHPEAVLLPVEEAATVGCIIASNVPQRIR